MPVLHDQDKWLLMVQGMCSLLGLTCMLWLLRGAFAADAHLNHKGALGQANHVLSICM